VKQLGVEAPKSSQAALAVAGVSLGDYGSAEVAANVDPELREYLRQWRRETARRQGVSAFLVMHDTSLDELCHRNPKSLIELRSVPGFGERKTEQYGNQILEAMEQFRRGARVESPVEKKSKPAEETIRLLAEGRSFEEIATIRGRQVKTVVSLVADQVEKGLVEFQSAWVDKDRLAIIEAACARLGTDWLKPLKESLPPEITYDEIRLVVARLRRESQRKSA
jgi:ATP-dependent DNA helicase RecQ